MRRKLFLCVSILTTLLVVSLILVSCGGGSDSGAIPDITNQGQNTTENQNLVTKDVTGFVYATGSISSSEAGEEETNNFVVMEIPMTGEDGFPEQVSEYIREEVSSKANSPEMEELLDAFIEEAGQYQPLPAWNSSAGLYSSYADSLSSAPIPISADGEISSSVLVDSGDDLISLDVVIPDGECLK